MVTKFTTIAFTGIPAVRTATTAGSFGILTA